MGRQAREIVEQKWCTGHGRARLEKLLARVAAPKMHVDPCT